MYSLMSVWDMKLNYIGWWGSIFGVLMSEQYLIIAIITSSTVTHSWLTSEGHIYGSKNQLKNISIVLLAKVTTALNNSTRINQWN